MNKACIKCRYCRIKLSVWFSTAVIAASVAVVVTGLVKLPV
jgi:hypothetical protein